MQTTETEQALDKRCREVHPERIAVGSVTYERNDIVAARFGETERTFNKRDRNGAPFAYFGGVKYRPLPDFDEHILSNIRRQRPPQPNGGGRGEHHDRTRERTRYRSRNQASARWKAASRHSV